MYVPFFENRRIQGKNYKVGLLWKRMPLIGLNAFLLLTINFVGLYFGYDFFNHDGLPAWWIILLQVLFIIFLDDSYFYFYHKFLHDNKWALRNIHGVHHQAIMPFPLEYIYVHPLEWFMGTFGPFLAIFVAFAFGLPINQWAFWLYIIIRNLHESDIHSGIKTRFMNKIPFLAPAEHHDLHHSRPFGNYASTFLIWDRVFATEIKSEDVKKKKR